jgi:poly [ADP-ribose] polymerase 6/8
MISDTKGDSSLLKKNLDKSDDLAFPLFRWIIASNKAHFAKVLKKDEISGLPSGIVQYIMVSGNPEREAIFRSKRKKYGSFYAFHGSSSGNWHCILRSGLKNYSGTSKMR